jgi:hypothetical protein
MGVAADFYSLSHLRQFFRFGRNRDNLMTSTMSVSDGLGIVADVLFGLWPLLLAAALLGRRARLSGVMLVWFILLAARIYTAVNVSSLSLAGSIRIIPEPTNTLVFIAVGALVVAVLTFRRQFFH